MVRTYVINIRRFEKEEIFRAALLSVSPYRQEKIALLKTEREKRRSMGAAFALNAALAYHGLCERDMEYVLGEQGKPMLQAYPGLHFSLSHAGDYAICSMGELENGCDVERVRPDKMRVAERFFAEEEKAWIYQAGETAERDRRLFRLWTMKESFLKVTGRGMALPLRDFTVLIGENGIHGVRHSINSKCYYMKEYSLPDFFREMAEYRISVCCEVPEQRMDICHEIPEQRIICHEASEQRTDFGHSVSEYDAAGYRNHNIPEFAPELEIVLP